MTELKNKIKVSTPGRICLFGEHQDYLGLPVIASAFSKRIYIEGGHSGDDKISIELPDINSRESFSKGELLEYTGPRDYLKSSFNVLLKNGYTFSKGISARIHGEIPINAGASSSSALIVSWINFLIRMSDQQALVGADKIAELAHAAEVIEFGEPGGMMDHYATALGGIIFINFYPEVSFERFSSGAGTIVIGDSGEPKDTTGILARVKNGVINIVAKLKNIDPSFSLQNIRADELDRFDRYLDAEQAKLLRGTVANRDITFSARAELKKENPDLYSLGKLMNAHQDVLRDILKISTPKIDKMVEAALNAGALCAKINGSGGGGTMFALCGSNPEKVLNALSEIASRAFITNVDSGHSAEEVL